MIPKIDIIPIYFFFSLFISFMVLYITAPMPKIIVKYPDPANKMSDMYVDDKGVCYRYKTEEISCP